MASTSSQQAVSPKKITQNGSEIFMKAVKYILTEWPSLELAIENGMGGHYAKDKRDWICQTIGQAVLNEKDIDLEDYLAEMINQEFDTLIEDGSLEYNIQWINKFYKDCIEGKELDVLEAIQKAAQKKVSLGNVKIPKPICQTNVDDEDSDNEEEESDNDMMN